MISCGFAERQSDRQMNKPKYPEVGETWINKRSRKKTTILAYDFAINSIAKGKRLVTGLRGKDGKLMSAIVDSDIPEETNIIVYRNPATHCRSVEDFIDKFERSTN